MHASAQSTETSDEIRARILAAASQRFAQFGYNKTTMAEIAEDCDMSAANLYRFFKNKLDIGANLACGCLDNKLTLVKTIVQENDRPAADRLHDVVMQNLHYTHGQWANDPRMNELVNAICDARMEIVNQYKTTERALLIELLEDGIRRDEFTVENLEETATAIASATTAFSTPLFMPLYPLEVFEQRAKGVVRLLLNGLKKH